MKLFICEKPTQAADIAKALGGARKTGFGWETNGGIVTNCFGHMLELAEPETYDPKYKQWNFADLPIHPAAFRYEPKRDCSAQLRNIGELLAKCSEVVIATDADREGEMIGREVLVHHRYKGPVSRLWLSALDEESVRKALSRLKPGHETERLYFAALARSKADWLVGMNMTRGMTRKIGGAGVFSVGRVQSPTVALIVARDLAIENFRPRDYFEIAADIRTDSGKAVTLYYGPKEEEKRLWDREKAEAIAQAAQGQRVTLTRDTEDKRQGPPKLFALSGLQKRANALWGWAADKTLNVAQSLYETHKATTYPRTDCEFLPEEQIPDVGIITGHLLGLDAFRHLVGQQFNPRKTVFNTAKITAHHAIIPTKIAPPLAAMSEDERKAYFLIATHYLASLLADYEYRATRIASDVTVAGAVYEFAITGNTPVKPGWKVAFGADALEGDESDGAVTLPDIPNGAPGNVAGTQIEGKKTKPPARYTEGTLIEDMMSIAKFVANPALKARLKETSGIGTEATRANIIKTIKDREYVATKGKQLFSTEKGRTLVATAQQELPAVVDPAETAVWEEGLEDVAEGRKSPDQFVAEIGGRIREYLAVLGKKPDAVRAGAVAGKPTGLRLGNSELLDHGDFFTAEGALPARIYKDIWGHKLTADEVISLVEGRAEIEVTDCRRRDGAAAGPKKLRYNPHKKPYPGVEVVAEPAPAVPTTAVSPRKGGGLIQDHGMWYTVPGYESNGYPVRFFKRLAGREITAEELAEVLASKEEGVKMSGFKKGDGTPFRSDPIVRYNARKKPYAGLEFEFPGR